jgi:hypothetical protein
MKIMEKTTIEKPRSKSRNQIRKEVGRGTKHRHEIAYRYKNSSYGRTGKNWEVQ